MEKIHSFKIFLIAIVLALTAIAPAYANVTDADLKRQQTEARRRGEESKRQLAATREEKSEVQAELDQLDEEYDIVTEEFYFISDQLDIVTEELFRTELALENATAERETQYEVYKERVRVMYMSGSVGYLEVLFSARDFSDFLSKLDFVNLITEYDRTALERLQSIEAEIEEYRNGVERNKREVEILKEQLERKQIELEIKQRQKNALFEQLTRDERRIEQQISADEREDRRIENLLKEREAARQREAAARARANTSTTQMTYSGPGKIGWPLSGSYKMTSDYAMRTSPIHGRREFHAGIDWSAATGTAILASDSGVVIYSGSMGGYGRTVIVDHQNGMSTLYAHASRLDVSVGQRVSRGQTIARVGSTGQSTGPHLHFEVRIGSGHTNPWPYLR